jgi:hypothetical protein
MRKFIKNPYAERIRQNGCTIRVTRGEGADKIVVEERIVTPEEIEALNRCRDSTLDHKGVQII